MESDKDAMGSDTDPTRIVWGPIQIPHGVHGIRNISPTECMGSTTDPMRSVWGPIHIHYRMYGARYRRHADCMGSDTDVIRNVSDPIQAQTGCMLPNTFAMRTVWCLTQIPCGLYGVPFTSHVDCMGPDTSPMSSA